LANESGFGFGHVAKERKGLLSRNMKPLKSFELFKD